MRDVGGGWGPREGPDLPAAPGGLGPRNSEPSRWLSSPEGEMGDFAASASTMAAR